MLGLQDELLALEAKGKRIVAGVVGAGHMGTGMISMMACMKGIDAGIIIDRNTENAKNALLLAGIPEEKIRYADQAEEADRWVAEGNFVYSDIDKVATDSRLVEVIIEGTGSPEKGASVALETIAAKKHIVMLNAEADAVIGPYLKKKADDAGVIYTGAAGDEPGAVKEIYDHATAMGLEVLVIGKGKNNKVDLECNPDTVYEEAVRRGAKPHMIAAFKEGSKTMVEMALMCNATGFVPDIRGAHGVSATLEEVVQKLSLKKEGGVLNQYGVVEYVDGIAPGVFAIVTTDKERVHQIFQYVSMGKGPNYILYRPFHLVSLETPLSAVQAVLHQKATIVPKNGLVAEVVTVAKKDMQAGENLDGIGGYTVYGTIERYQAAKSMRALPIGLVNRQTKLLKNVRKGEIITYDAVSLDTSSLLYQLRMLQDEMFN